MLLLEPRPASSSRAPRRSSSGAPTSSASRWPSCCWRQTPPSRPATRARATSPAVCRRADVLIAAVGVPQHGQGRLGQAGRDGHRRRHEPAGDGLTGDVDFDAAVAVARRDHAGPRRRRADDDRLPAAQHAAGCAGCAQVAAMHVAAAADARLRRAMRCSRCCSPLGRPDDRSCVARAPTCRRAWTRPPTLWSTASRPLRESGWSALGWFMVLLLVLMMLGGLALVVSPRPSAARRSSRRRVRLDELSRDHHVGHPPDRACAGAAVRSSSGLPRQPGRRSRRRLARAPGA